MNTNKSSGAILFRNYSGFGKTLRGIQRLFALESGGILLARDNRSARKRELCDKIFELESERDDLLKEIPTLKSEQNEDSPIPGGLFAKRNLSRGLASLSGGSV